MSNSLQEYGRKKRKYFGTVGTPVAIDTTTDITGGGEAVFYVTDVYRVGVLVTTSYTVPASGALTITLASADPVHASPATFATLSFGTTDYDIGDIAWADVIVPVAQASGDDTLSEGTTSQTSLINVAPAGPLRLSPGQAYELTVANAAAAGDGIIVVEYVEFDEARPNGVYGGEVYVNP